MTIRAVAVVPHPPLLVPELAGDTDPLPELRSASLDAVRALGDGPVLVVGSGPESARYDRGSFSFAPYGADVRVGFGGGGPTLPLSLGVGVWLLSLLGLEAAAARSVNGEDDDFEVPDGWALLVLGDGSATRGPKAPAGEDARGELFDLHLASLLRQGAVARESPLADLDPIPELRVAGTPAFRALGRARPRRTMRGRLLYEAAPFGVGYVVAVWT